MRKFLLFNLIVFFSLVLFSCANSNGAYNDMSPTVLGDFVNEHNEDLTCISINDNLYYDNWLKLSYLNGAIFNDYASQFKLNTQNRITIETSKGFNLKVDLLDEADNIVMTNYTGANGKCYLFPNWHADKYKVKYSYYDEEMNLIENYDYLSSGTYFSPKGQFYDTDVLELMFVIDTTISMNDELDYLKHQIKSIIEELNDDIEHIIKIAILLYKDRNEVYETLYSDFTTDIDSQLEFLANKIAYGGQDYEEAVDLAFSEAALKSWSNESVNKIIVHIGDAPAHDEYINNWYNSVLDLTSKGVRIITVASSGINKKTEYLFRTMTLVNNGTYVAITNHSGIGDNHIDPSIDVSLKIEYLDECLIRLIKYYCI